MIIFIDDETLTEEERGQEDENEGEQQIAQTFLDLLEEKQLDWKKEWSGNGTQSPYNANSGHRYKGINRFYLSLIAMSRGYQEPRWATFYQIKERGWRLNNAKGQGVKVEYWFPYDTEEKKMVSWQKFRESWEKFGERYLLRVQYSTVFNADLIEGIPALNTVEYCLAKTREKADRTGSINHNTIKKYGSGNLT